MSIEDHYRELEKKYVYGTWRHETSWNPIVMDEGEGCYLTSVSGKRYLDFSSQLMCSNLGHSSKAVIDAIAEQARKLPYAAPGFATVPAALLAATSM